MSGAGWERGWEGWERSHPPSSAYSHASPLNHSFIRCYVSDGSEPDEGQGGNVPTLVPTLAAAVWTTDLDRLAAVLEGALEEYEGERATRSEPTLDLLELLRAHAHAVADQVDAVLEEWLGDDDGASSEAP